MANNLLLIDTVAQNIKAQLNLLDTKYFTKLYDTTIKLTRGTYGFNVLPTEFITREFTGSSSLPDLMIDMFCYYTMNEDEERDKQWTIFLTAMSAVRDALIKKTNIPSPLATVKIDVNFHDDILEMKTSHRAINCVMSMTYQKYAFEA